VSRWVALVFIMDAESIVATTVAATAAITAASTATVAATPAAACSARGSRPGFVDRQPAAIMVLAVKALDCRHGFVVVRHLHETKTPAPSGLAVAQNLRRRHRSILFEQFLQVFGCCRVLEISNIKTLRHRSRPKRLSTDILKWTHK
jgi:hypothetical protein